MILNHYPPVIKQIKDIQQIAKAEDIEFTKLNMSTSRERQTQKEKRLLKECRKILTFQNVL